MEQIYEAKNIFQSLKGEFISFQSTTTGKKPVKSKAMLSWLYIGLFASAMVALLSILHVRYVRPLPLKYPNKQAKVECRCGKVKFRLRNYESCFRLQCCCKECRKRVEWVRSLGYDSPKYEPPVRGVWLHNAISKVEGEKNLKPWKLNAEMRVPSS